MWKFIRHEWKYWIYSPMTWIFFIINTLLVMGAVSSDSITIGGGVGSVHKNALFVIPTDNDELLIPVGDDYITEIDHEKKIIYMNLPEGLLEI